MILDSQKGHIFFMNIKNNTTFCQQIKYLWILHIILIFVHLDKIRLMLDFFGAKCTLLSKDNRKTRIINNEQKFETYKFGFLQGD